MTRRLTTGDMILDIIKIVILILIFCVIVYSVLTGGGLGC